VKDRVGECAGIRACVSVRVCVCMRVRVSENEGEVKVDFVEQTHFFGWKRRGGGEVERENGFGGCLSKQDTDV